MLDAGGGGAQEKIAQKAVTVGAHGDEVASFVLDPLDDLVGGLAVGKFGVGRDGFGLEFGLDFLQVSGVFDDFAADGVGTIGAGGPSVGDVEKDHAAVSEFREVLYVLDDGPVG